MSRKRKEPANKAVGKPVRKPRKSVGKAPAKKNGSNKTGARESVSVSAREVGS